MAEIDAANADAAAGPNPNPGTPPTAKTSNPREEGELSPSDDDELPASSEGRDRPACSTEVTTGAVGCTAEPIIHLLTSKSTQGIKKGKSVSTNNPASCIGIRRRVSMQTNYSRTTDKNRAPFKSVAPGWYGPSPASDNLVISFSDDDSGSDCDKYKKEKSSGTKIKAMGVDGNRRPPVLSQPKSVMLRNTLTNENKVVPKKLSSSCTSISSMNKIHGANSRGALLSTELKSGVKNDSTHNPSLASQGRGLDKGSDLNNSKLQDLRQQIAIRESELKLKSAHQTKEIVSGTSRDHNALNLDSDSTRKYGGTFGGGVQLDLKEPDKKRLKAIGPYFGQKILDGQQEVTAANPFLLPKDQGQQGRHLQYRDTVDCSRGGKGISMGRIKPDVKSQKQDNRKRPASFENLGADINTSCSQSDRSTQRVDPCSVVNQSAALPVVAFNEPNNLNNVEFNCATKVDGHHPSSSFPNRASSGHNLMRGNDDHEVISKEKVLKPTSSDVHQTSQKSTSTWNGFDTANVPRHSNNMDIQSLTAMEEMLDKDLEDAQEHRRRCEIEERKALKAYRKAQRALFEANSKCNHLYRQRELCSAQFGSFIMDDSTLLWSSRPQEPDGIGLHLSDNMIENNMDQLPMPTHTIQGEFGGFNQVGHVSNIQCNDGAHISYQRMNGLTLGSEPCSELDASTSEILPHMGKKTANRVRSLSNDPNISADEDEETFPCDHEMDQPIGSPRRERSSEEGMENINMTKKKHPLDNHEDSLLLEANLRSELCARFGMKAQQDSGSFLSMQPSFKQWAKEDVGTVRTQVDDSCLPSTEAEKIKQVDLRGTGVLERTVSEVLSDFQSPDYESGVSLPAFILRSVFRHMKVSIPIGFVDSCTSIQKSCLHNNNDDEGIHVESDKIQLNSLREARDTFGKDIGSYACDLAIDPFWPLCMYELRGKCNDDECSWQHVKDYLGKSMNNHGKSAATDGLVGSSSERTMFNVTTKESEHPKFLAQPTYLVGLDTLATDPLTCKSNITRASGQCWRRCFSIALAVSSSLQTELAADEPLLHGCDGRVEVYGSWSRQALYFRTKNGGVTQYKQGLPDSVQSLEIALLVLNQEVSQSEGIKKALSVLSRALETDPTSVPVWIVYLVIFSSNKKSDGKDDMFSQAVKHNEGSYELWLMYIKSRMQLKDQLDAYDAALSALCRCVSTSGRDFVHDSRCILDLFLQMTDCLCMSGNVSEAIQRVHGLLSAKRNSDDTRSWSFSDILSCLTISDKCIFWICCVYLLTYRKLPDTIVEQFEVEKDLVRVEWPSVHLTDERKKQAVKLMEMAVDSVESDIRSGTLKHESALRSLHLFAVNHIRCMVALDGLLDCRITVDKYTKLYPTSLELVLISLWVHGNDYGGLSFAQFEDVIGSWPKGVPGLHCLWNLYAEYALQNGRTDFAKELMGRWFNSIWKVQSPSSSGIVDVMNIGGSCILLGSNTTSNTDTLCSDSNQIDKMFGLLNLCLHKLLENDHSEARRTIDEALKAAAPKCFEYCVREHATFLRSELKDASVNRILTLLTTYMDGTRVTATSEPLSRKFLNFISKPRVQQLIGSILSPVSPNFSLINSVLEIWYGPSLFPQGNSKDLVDFVEAILEISPSNYKLAISVCKHLCSSDVTSVAVMYWACLLLVRTMFQAIPIAPESIWIEAANILGNVTRVEAISETFHKRALSVYPFSVKLWKSYRNLYRSKGDTSNVLEAARKKGIELD